MNEQNETPDSVKIGGLSVASGSAGPVKITRICYCCSKCGVVIAYEEQPCPLCAARQEALELRAINLRLHETIHAYKDQWVDEHV